MPALIRSASLTHYAELARACGLDPLRMVAEAGLPSDCLREPDLKIPADAVRELLERSAQRSGLETFGLRLAETRRLSNLGPLALLVREEATLRGALDALARYGALHNQALFLHIEEVGTQVVLRQEMVVGRGVPMRQSTELALGVFFRLLRVLLGPGWTPRRVCFTHTAPADRSVHERLFGPRVEFSHDFNGIVCTAGDLDALNPGADPVMARYARQVLETSLQSGATGIAHEVRQLVFVLLPSGQCCVELVAQHLGVDRRTVHRQLAHEGETFSAIVEATRRELVVRYLDDGTQALSDVALLLGFAAPSAFSRWHQTQFGTSATSRRKELREKSISEKRQ